MKGREGVLSSGFMRASAWCELGIVVSGFCDLDLMGGLSFGMC